MGEGRAAIGRDDRIDRTKPPFEGRLIIVAGDSSGAALPHIGPYQDALLSASFKLFGTVPSHWKKGDLHARLSLELEDSIRPCHSGIQRWPGCIDHSGVG